ncbi:MAG: hypothetical protein ACYTHJ_10440 [Planctomycetota bacterium]|jgi:hypothetical protein
MTPIHSGTTSERVIRSAAMVVIAAFVGASFLYDGFYGYNNENIREVYATILQVEPPHALPVNNPKLTADMAKTLAPPITNAELVEKLGQPHAQVNAGAVYFGFGGFLMVKMTAGRITDVEWRTGPQKSALDLQVQKIIGAIGTLAFFVFGLRFLLVLKTRASLTEDGLALERNPVIALDQIRAIRQGRNAEIVLLDYEAGGKKKTVTLDRYVLKEQPAIVEAIQEKTGLELQ